MARQMKDSGIEWIGEIPADWNSDRLQWHLEEVKVQNSPIKSEQILSLTIESGVIPYEEKGNQGNKAKENLEEYKLAYPDTLVVNSMNVIIGAVGISKYFGCVSPVYYVFRATEGTNLRYIYYLFTNGGFQKEMRKYAKGILEIRLRISASDMLKRIVPKPSYEEQCRISDFLDKKCAEIDAVIAKTKATIEEYKKLKQSVITEAVTKGIRGDRPMKDVDFEMIGKIPIEWDCVRVSRIATVVRGASPRPAGDSRYFNGDYIPWITVAEVTNSNGIYINSTETYLTEEGSEQSRIVEKGTLLLSNSGATLGVPKITNIKGCINDGSVAFYDLKLGKKYLLYVFSSYTEELRKQRQGYGQPNLNTDLIKALFVPNPSSDEQEEIVKYLDKKCAEIDTLIAKKTSLLEEMENYKKSVIYEYVTGKKEVK